jgi:diacylglycerol kinase family enzyme
VLQPALSAGVVSPRMPPAPPIESFERLGEAFPPTADTERKRMLVIVNPYATTVSDRLRNLVVYALQGRYEVQAVDTKGRDHATELCREAAMEGYDVVVAFGGDGTVNEAANGLIGSGTPLTCLPGGATNVFCKMLGIPGDIVDATEHLLRIADDWRPRAVDVAMVNGRRFTFSCGVGIDASVVEEVDAHPRLKARFGPYYFTWAALSTFWRRYVVNPPRMVVELPGGTEHRAVTAIVQNGDPFTYFQNRPLHVAEGATLTSGDLAGVVLHRSTPTVMPTVIWRIFSGNARIVRHRAISGFGGIQELVIRSEDGRELPIEVDGDFIGHVSEAVFGIQPRALTVVS